MMMGPRQAEALHHDLLSNNDLSNNDSSSNNNTVVDPILERWIKRNIPEHVLMRPTPSTPEEQAEEVRLSRRTLLHRSSGTPKGTSAPSTVVCDPSMTRRIDVLASPSHPLHSSSQDAAENDVGPVWVPTGVNSSLTSFHRQQLADAQTALRTLKKKKEEQQYASDVFRGTFFSFAFG